jgi:fatty-acyl-CoA synthase
VSVPPYHIAGIAAVLSSVWSGRRLVYLPQFSAEAWVDLAAREAVTHAMVVPTMLGRILEVLVERDEQAAGAAPPLLRRGPHADGPGRAGPRAAAPRRPGQRLRAHRDQLHHRRPRSRGPPRGHRLGRARRAPPARLGGPPAAEPRGRDPRPTARPLGAGTHGEIWVRGEQVSGEYLGRASAVSADGWLATNDGGWLDEAGLPLRRGPPRRRDRPGRREPLARRDRRGPPLASRRGRRRRDRGPRRGVGGGGGGGRRAGRGRRW